MTLSAGCQSPGAFEGPRPSAEGLSNKQSNSNQAGYSIYVASNGWHTSIVLARSDLPAGAIPEADDFPGAAYLEFSWGDARYFPASEKGLGMTMSALLTPTPAVLHLAGLPARPRIVFPTAEVVELNLTSEGFRALVTYLDETFARDSAQPSNQGLYRFSRFYPATGNFHLFNTCNTWTARGLAAADLPVTVTGTLQAEDLMAQLR
ncbi:MAG: DUF2459 domain-containing protein [Gammaproteobacteria bacterium]|nr:DUF2459 domain-containing protein [Gammaproteobacteria bacterium]